MNNNPLVSIIVASYNNAAYIDDMINSILQQTYSNWELIITDDASPDNSNEIIEKYVQKYPKKIKLFKHKENKGAGAAFKTCMDNVKGEIITMLGADDALKKHAIDVIVQKYKSKQDAAMIISGLEHTDANLKPIGKLSIFEDLPEGVNSILENGSALGWDTFKYDMYKKTEGFIETQKRAVDQDLYFKLEEVGKIYFIKDCLYLYRENEKGISQGNNWLEAYKFRLIAIDRAMKRRRISKKQIPVYEKMLHTYYIEKAVNAKKNKNYQKSLKYVFKALLVNPREGLFLKINIIFRPLKYWKK